MIWHTTIRHTPYGQSVQSFSPKIWCPNTIKPLTYSHVISGRWLYLDLHYFHTSGTYSSFHLFLLLLTILSIRSNRNIWHFFIILVRQANNRASKIPEIYERRSLSKVCTFQVRINANRAIEEYIKILVLAWLGYFYCQKFLLPFYDHKMQTIPFFDH